MRAGIAILVLFFPLIARSADLRAYETRYYTLHTDLAADQARYVSLRMTRMAEEYAYRTRGFSGAITQRMPFYLYSNAEDYFATGAPRSSGGYFNGRELVAVARDLDARTWHRVQHEGFHQFARMVIGGQIPTWVNEGLAEYFGEGLFTGDGFVTGVVPPWRLKRVRESIDGSRFLPITGMMQLSLDEWNADVNVINYDQAWSMVHFLAHGENERYQPAFGAFMVQIGRGTSWQDAWKQTFGDTAGFEQRWRKFWTDLPQSPTQELYIKANVAVWTSYLARAYSQKQTFDDFDAFLSAAEGGQLKAHNEDWLPPVLLAEAIHDAREYINQGYRYQLVTAERLPQIVCSLPDGRRVAGRFTVRGDRVGQVTAQNEKATTRPARGR
jgi:Protein of unknown function (DUF1570)